MTSLARRIFSEWLGTTFLLSAVVGSGIMAQKLAGGNVALALLCNTIPTGAKHLLLWPLHTGYGEQPRIEFGATRHCRGSHLRQTNIRITPVQPQYRTSIWRIARQRLGLTQRPHLK